MAAHVLKHVQEIPSAQVMAKLRRIYGQGALQRDVFGRRPALASEVARHLQRRRSPADDTIEGTRELEGERPR